MVVGLCIFPIIGSIVLLCVPPGDSSSTKGGLLVAFYLLQLFQAVSLPQNYSGSLDQVYPTIWIMLSRNVAGQSKKSIVYATTCESSLTMPRLTQSHRLGGRASYRTANLSS